MLREPDLAGVYMSRFTCTLLVRVFNPIADYGISLIGHPTIRTMIRTGLSVRLLRWVIGGCDQWERRMDVTEFEFPRDITLLLRTLAIFTHFHQ
jgi:hypothetical protein